MLNAFSCPVRGFLGRHGCLITIESAREGQALDIDPEAGKDRVGARRDKGHRYLRFETQVGRAIISKNKKNGNKVFLVYTIVAVIGRPAPGLCVCPENTCRCGQRYKQHLHSKYDDQAVLALPPCLLLVPYRYGRYDMRHLFVHSHRVVR